MEMFILGNVLVYLGKDSARDSGFTVFCMIVSVYDCSCFCSKIIKFILCRLGQACNHIAALLFFIDNYGIINAENLPTDLSKTSKPMAWNQPPKKTVTPECSSNMQFIKLSHGDLPLQRISRSTFDPRCVEH